MVEALFVSGHDLVFPSRLDGMILGEDELSDCFLGLRLTFCPPHHVCVLLCGAYVVWKFHSKKID